MVTQKIALKQMEFLKTKSNKMRLAAEGWANDWQRLVSIVLSARTRDEVTIVVCEKMFEKFGTPEKFSKLNVENIKRLIGPINFFENKAKYLHDLTKMLLEDFEGKVPREIEKMIELPGVGRKTANVFLAEEGGANIGVDTHVNYISNYLNWTKSNNPEVIERDLQKLLPKEKWGEVNNTLVHFGKTYTSRKEKDKLLEEAKKIK